jgi:Tol biopolymer transport system component
MKLSKFNFIAVFLFAITLGGCINNPVSDDQPIELNDLYLYNVTKSTTTKITNSPKEFKGLYSFSPDSKKVLFNSGEQTYLMNIDGSGKTMFNVNFTSYYAPGGGNQIAYSNNGDLFTINYDGTNMRQITNSSIDYWDPALSPDGLKIACIASTGINIIDLNGSATIISTSSLAGSFNWSPDSKELIYSKYSTNSSQIYKYNLTENKEYQLTNSPEYENTVSWNAQKNQIIFTSSSLTNGTDLVIMNPDGSQQKTIIHKKYIGSPYWSPDGTKIVFLTENSDLAIINLDGSNYHIINEISGVYISPVWSPDGKYILYSYSKQPISYQL